MIHSYLRKHLPLFFLVALFLAPQAANAATLSITPANASIHVGDTVTVSVRVSTANQAMNASSGTLSFPADLLRVVSVSKSNSVLTLWVQDPSFSNSGGTVEFSGVVPNPGYTGNGPILTVTFAAKKTGTASVSFSSSSVLANDGNGTNILTTANPASITISPAEAVSAPVSAPSSAPTRTDLFASITSSTHPDQTKWYNVSHAVLDWTNAQGVTAVRLGYDQNADGVPSIPYSDPISHKELQLEDGIWYFHVQEKGSSGWGPVSTFRIQIDTVVPDPIVLQFPNGLTTASTTLPAKFGTTDALSGIDHYLLSVDGNSTIVSTSGGEDAYPVPSGDPGTHILSVTAYDKAGNSVSAQQQFTTILSKQPDQSPSTWGTLVWLVANYLSLILIVFVAVGIVVFSGWYLWRRFHIFRRHTMNAEERRHILIHRHFNDLKNAIVDEILSLEKVKSKRELTIEEERLINRLQKLIDESESFIDKKIDEDAEKIARRVIGKHFSDITET